MKYRVIIFSILLFSTTAKAQGIQRLADSVRRQYNIPELGYAIVSGDSIIDMQVSGFKRIDRPYTADINDRFRIGSNTKSVTAFIAARLVKSGLLKWDTRFFDLFPEWRNEANKDYNDITLLQLLSFRAGTVKWTYTNDKPTQNEINGNEEEQRRRFALWALQQPATKGTLSFSNPGYTLAGLMLERASGKSYIQLVNELNAQLGLHFAFGTPNVCDTIQPWGHNAELIPEIPSENYKLNWLQPAGNLNSSLPDYARFIQLQLRGLEGKSELLSKQEFEYMHYGLPDFAIGWFWTQEAGHKASFHTGNPGTFLSYVYVDAARDRAYILFANVQSAEAEEAFSVLGGLLKDKYFK
jgi:CubicO group peptidase (beta-lactamase class C family)